MSIQTPPVRTDAVRPKVVRRPGDRVFAGVATGAGILILLLLAGVAGFLLVEAWPAITTPADQIAILHGDSLFGYIAPLIGSTLLAAVLALVIATPVAVSVALFISHYAPRRMSQGLGYLVDLLAAVPSIIFGLWGVAVLAPATVPSTRWLAENLGFLPFFAGPASSLGRTMLVAGLVLAVMILPIITAVCREVFLQTPRLHEEAALALGATRWEMIRMTVLPFGRSGMVSGAMLGLGRALGETMAVVFVLSTSADVFSFNLISDGNVATIAANIALQFPESAGLDVNVLVASGLVLFGVTLAVNMFARYIVNRRSEFSGADG